MIIDRRHFLMSVGVGSVVSACGSNSCWPTKVKSFPSGAKRVDVNMMGLIGIVRGQSTEALYLLLVDGDSTLGVKHDPLLLIPTSLKSKSDLKPTKTAPRPHNTEICDWYDLTGYDIEVGSGLSGGPRVDAVTGLRQAGHQAPAGDEADVSWIAEMKKIPGVKDGKINPACLDSNAKHVAARFRFDFCEVASAFPPRFKDKIFQFGSGASAYAQALAIPSIRAAASASGAGLTLTLSHFSGSAVATISVPPGDVLSPTNIYVYNEPHDEIVCSTNDDVRKLKHFGAFYKLLAETVNDGPIPTCVGDNCPVCPTTTGGVGSSEDIHCPSGAFGRG